MFTLLFWRATLERAIKTGAEFVLAVLGIAGYTAGIDSHTAETVNALTWNYLTLGGAFLAGAVLAVLVNLATAAMTNGNPSTTDAEVLAPTVEPLGKHRADPPAAG